MVIFPNGIKADAVIFDFDGIMVDTEPLHYQAFQTVLEPLEFGFSWQEYREKYMGYDDRDAFTEAFRAKGKAVNSEELACLIKNKALAFLNVIKNGITPYPGVVDLVTQLHHKHIPIAISSGALQSDIKPILKILNIENCFKIIVTADDVSKSKPDPESYCLAFDKIKSDYRKDSIAVTNTIAIEDTPAGIASAKAACLQVVAVTNSYPCEHLTEADFIIQSLEELLGFNYQV